jgi:membrane protease subunit (stomatin/prohibitin family)
VAVADIIKYEGENNTLVWKHPLEDFNTLTQLIVHEAQEAIFFRNGQALDLFHPGRYTLKTQNIPILRKLLNLPTGGVSPFHCEVYFINKVMTLNVKWGTNTSAEVIDPRFNILLNVGASGGMGVQVADSRKFLTKLVGTEPNLTVNGLQGYFRENIAMRAKSYITRIMGEVSFAVVNQRLNDISLALQNQLALDMGDFGIKLVNFYVSTIHIPDEDKEKIKEALAATSARAIQGYNWMDEQMADIAKKYAANPGSVDNVAGMAAQMPMAFAFGQMLSNVARPLAENVFSPTLTAFGRKPDSGQEENDVAYGRKCINCGSDLSPASSFCSKCGTAIPQDTDKVRAKFCHACGRKLAFDDNFCSKCGTKAKRDGDHE